MNIFVFFYIADILPMFADIFADKSDNIFLDPRRYIRRHDICNIEQYHNVSEFKQWLYPKQSTCTVWLQHVNNIANSPLLIVI